MVHRVTDRNSKGLNPRAQREIAEILATFTGPRTRLLEAPNGFIEMIFSWDVQNIGQATGNVGLRVNLQVDNFFGDASQLIVEADGSVVGPLSDAATVGGNFPLTISPGVQDSLRLTVVVPTADMISRQGSVQGFNWWIAESIVRDLRTNQNVDGDSRGEIRDWFLIDPVSTAFTVLRDPVYSVRQLTFG